MVEKALFQNIPEEDRASALEGLAVKTENQKVRRHYTQDEKDQMKEYISSESIDLMDKDAEFSEIKKEFNKALKSYKEAIKNALTCLKKGYSENEELVYMIDDQENSLMNIYDKRGELILSRALYPEERQTRMINLSEKTGTNG